MAPPYSVAARSRAVRSVKTRGPEDRGSQRIGSQDRRSLFAAAGAAAAKVSQKCAAALILQQLFRH
jgi:hypothetical protein